MTPRDRPASLDVVHTGPERAVVVLGVLAVVAWLGSYSWLLWAVLPLPDVRPTTSPWLVSEILAVILGVASVVVLLTGRRPGAPRRRRARAGATAGGAAALLALISLML